MQAQTYDNVVIGNRITANGQPGVALHAHKAGAILTGNLVAGKAGAVARTGLGSNGAALESVYPWWPGSPGYLR